MYGYSVPQDNGLSSSEQDADSAKGTPKAPTKPEDKDGSCKPEPPDTLLPEELTNTITTSSPTSNTTNSTASSTTTSKKAGFARPGANQSVLSRLRPVPERRSMRLFQTDTSGDVAFSECLAVIWEMPTTLPVL